MFYLTPGFILSVIVAFVGVAGRPANARCEMKPNLSTLSSSLQLKPI